MLYFQYANAIEEFKAAMTDQANYECISCERLLQRKSVTQAKNMKGSAWNRLMSFKLLNDPLSLQNKVLYICTNCKTIIKNDKVPGRCVLKVLSAEFYFHKPITVHLELYLFYCFIQFLLYIGQY